MQEKLIVGIQGGAGSYHELVAKKYFDNTSLIYLQTFGQVFNELISETIDYAVVAIANNRYGFIPETFGLLMQNHNQIAIVGEYYLSIKHQLLAVKGARLKDIEEVHSQAPALGQCGIFLQSSLSDAILIEEEDTALSAQLVHNSKLKSKAAIASAEAARLYDLEVIASDIQDDENNLTRFYILQNKNKAKPTKNAHKTTALLNTTQIAGSLVDALQPFKEQSVNISTLHSSFLPNSDFDMQFLIEFDAAMSDEKMNLINADLKRTNASLTVLGSYKNNFPTSDL